MKKSILVLALILISVSSFCSLEVYFMYSTFNSPDGPYIETYLSTIGSSAQYVKKLMEVLCLRLKLQ